jgi:serine/threonine protein kinase
MDSFDSHNYRVVREDRPTAIAQVYEATHAERPGRLLVEVLSAGLITGHRLEAFERDVATITLLDHPCVLEVLDLGALSDGTPVVISDYPEGTTLARWLEEDLVASPDEAIEIVTGLAEALTAAHQSGVTHGVLRADQVYLVKDAGGGLGIPKLRGFGQRWLSPSTTPPDPSPAGPSPEELADDVRALARIAEVLLTPPKLRGDNEGMAFDAAPASVEVLRTALAGGHEGFGFPTPRAFALALTTAFHPPALDRSRSESRALVLAGVRALTRWRQAPKLAVGLAAGVSISVLLALVVGLMSQSPPVEARSAPGGATGTAPVEVPVVSAPAAPDPAGPPAITGMVTFPAIAVVTPARPHAVATITPARPASSALRSVVWSDSEHALITVDEHGVPLPPRGANPQP